MDFIDKIKQLAKRLEKLKSTISTEEATKMSLIIPFFQALGYDVFNPEEFLPEFTADVGIKKGEKVDYAVMVEGKPAILIECKWCGSPLEGHDSQLFRYFGTTSAKFAILTNGIMYRFYTDLDTPNKMDLTPFLELDLENIKETAIAEVKKFNKDSFDPENLASAASELKYSNEIKAYFFEQLREPDDEFVKFMLSHAYDGVKTAAIIEKFRPVVKNALNNLIGEMMNDRITSALKKDTAPTSDIPPDDTPIISDTDTDDPHSRAVTTDDELQAFFIVKAILSESIDVSMITYKDTINYFSILFNGMATKWICRLRLDGNKKYIGLPGEAGKEMRHDISASNDLYRFKSELLVSAQRFFT